MQNVNYFKFSTSFDIKNTTDTQAEKLEIEESCTDYNPSFLGSLFNKENFCFYTKEKNRTPTFYFQDRNGICGRIRTQHAQGPTTREGNIQKRFFFKEYYNKILEYIADKLEGKTISKAIEWLYQHNILFSHSPHNGYQLIEFYLDTKGKLIDCHISSGQVYLPERLKDHIDFGQLYRECASAEDKFVKSAHPYGTAQKNETIPYYLITR